MTRIKVGSPIFELNFQNKKNTNKSIENRCYNIAKSALKIASSKLPIKTNIVSNI
jgi:ribosomal protein L16/L10AE